MIWHACMQGRITSDTHEIIHAKSSHVIDKVDPQGKVPNREGYTFGALQYPRKHTTCREHQTEGDAES